MKRQYEIGQTVGAFLILEYSRIGYVVRCVPCGREKPIFRRNVARDKSCGCLKGQGIAKAFTTHGGSRSPTWNSWVSMHDRCKNPKNNRWERYGGRGIKVCERWKKFENFLADMGWKPEGRTLDRIDNNGRYEPSNCRWATSHEQANNKSNNDILEMNGERMTLSEWSRKTGMVPGSLRSRIHDLGWPVERALTQQIATYRSREYSIDTSKRRKS